MPTPNLINVLIKKLNLFKFESVVRIANHNLDLKTTKFIIKNADIVLFNSNENKALYTKQFINFQEKFYYVNNIISPSYSKSNKNNIPSEKTNALVVSRLVTNKGIDLLINAMNELSQENISIDIYGVGPEFDYLNDLSKNKNVKFINEFSSIEDIWSKYNLFILPSRKEGMSNSLLEAQYNNIFSIVSNCKTGNNEIIDLTNNGILFKTEDYKDLKLKILNYLNGQYESKKSKEIIGKNFSEKRAMSYISNILSI